MSIDTARHGGRLPWGDVLLSAIASVSWALIAMAGTAALGLHLVGADAAGSLGPMTAAVVALGANGAVKPSGDVSAFGLKGAEAHTAIQITPLGVGLVGALLLSFFFLRSLRGAGVVIAPSELLARAGAVVVLFVATLGGLAWAGHDIITIDGSKLGLDRVTGGGLGNITDKLPGGLGDLGGLLPGKIGDLVQAQAAVGFTVDTVPTLLGGAAWAAGILVIALLASRRTPLPRGWEGVHRTVRPAASALVTVVLVAVLAGLAAAAYAAIGDPHPKLIAGAALLGAPNGVWLGIPIGLFVPWDGKATGELAKLLPHPLDRLLSVDSDQPVTLGRLAELDGRVWLLGVATAVMMLFAGVLAASRTPFVRGRGAASVGTPAAPVVRGGGALGFAGRCALRLGIVTALALPLLAWLTDVSVDASLSVFGIDAFGAGIRLHGHLGMALLLGAVWGAGAGAAGALLAYASGAAGRRAAPLALGDAGPPVAAPAPDLPRGPGPYAPGAPYRPANP
ncbi:streptophobe family protein, partial [Streptomyces sp. NPDC127044]